MTTEPVAVKPPKRAALKNVGACFVMARKLIERPADMDRIGVFFGPSGYGKTYASIYVRNRTRARLVEAGASWDRKTFLAAVLTECGVSGAKGTIAALTQQAIAALGDEPSRPLIIDEADKLVDRGMIEIIRELHDKARVATLLIGEEALPRKLEAIERVHNRVLLWEPAQPCDIEDCRKLADIFLPEHTITDGLLDQVRQQANGRARRIVTTLTNMEDWARAHGARALDEASYAGGFFTGAPPRRVLPEAEKFGGRA